MIPSLCTVHLFFPSLNILVLVLEEKTERTGRDVAWCPPGDVSVVLLPLGFQSPAEKEACDHTAGPGRRPLEGTEEQTCLEVLNHPARTCSTMDFDADPINPKGFRPIYYL